MKKSSLAFLLLLFTCLAQADETFSQRFERIRFWEPRDSVILRLGKPRLIDSYNVLGIKHETLTWNVGGGDFVITLVNDHVYGSKEKIRDPE
jgi:hypothetical protein